MQLRDQTCRSQGIQHRPAREWPWREAREAGRMLAVPLRRVFRAVSAWDARWGRQAPARRPLRCLGPPGRAAWLPGRPAGPLTLHDHCRGAIQAAWERPRQNPRSPSPPVPPVPRRPASLCRYGFCWPWPRCRRCHGWWWSSRRLTTACTTRVRRSGEGRKCSWQAAKHQPPIDHRLFSLPSAMLQHGSLPASL